MNKYKVEIVAIKGGKVEAVIGNGLSESNAEKRIMTGLMRIDRDNYFVRAVDEVTGQVL